MRAEVLYTCETHADLDDAFAWYENQRSGLGDEFLQNVASCIDQILDAPKRYAIFAEDYRRALVDRFPYAVVYQYDGRYVTVYSVIHTSRDPDLWRRRVP